jgi:hypothetical protein
MWGALKIPDLQPTRIFLIPVKLDTAYVMAESDSYHTQVPSSVVTMSIKFVFNN